MTQYKITTNFSKVKKEKCKGIDGKGHKFLSIDKAKEEAVVVQIG